MNTMNMPGFTAELSVNKAGKYFSTFGHFVHDDNSAVNMAQMFTPGPDDGLRLPGGIPEPPILYQPICFPVCAVRGVVCTPKWGCFSYCESYTFKCF